MAERIRKLTNSEVEVLARIIADTMTGSQMNEIFQECGVQDVSNESTKWKRIYYTFLARQEQDGASNSFLNFIIFFCAWDIRECIMSIFCSFIR